MTNYNMDNEVWKDIKGYEGLYQISNYGRVYSVKRKIVRKQKLVKGYLVVGLNKNNVAKTLSVHRLVAMHFINNEESKEEVNHIDEVKTNNHVSNLMWCTPKENSNWGSRRERLSKANKRRFVRPLSLDQTPTVKVLKLPKVKLSNKPSGYVEKRVKFKPGMNGGKEVYVLDKKTGDVVDRFVSVKAAARFYNLRQSNISYVCAGKLKTTGGYKFKFVS